LAIETKTFNASSNYPHGELERKKLACTDTINCPFFQNGNIDLNKLIVKKNLDDSNSEMNQISKTSTRVSGI
jgi:hypothetical protein